MNALHNVVFEAVQQTMFTKRVTCRLRATGAIQFPCVVESNGSGNSLVVVAMLVVFCVLCSASSGMAESLDRARDAWRDFRDAFLVSEVHESAEERNGPESQFLPHSVVFKFSGDNQLVIGETLEAGRWTGIVHCSNKGYAFELRRSDRGRPWVLTQLAQAADRDATAAIRRRLDIHRSEMVYPLKMNSVDLPELVSHPSFRLLAGEERTDGGRKVFDFSFAIDDPKARTSNGTEVRFTSGRVTLDPQRNWLPISSELRWPSGQTVRVEATAFDKRDGIVFPVHQMTWIRELDGREWKRSDWRFDRVLINTNVPEEAFKLAAFGLPEPDFSNTQIPWFWILGLIGIAIVAAGVYLRGAR